MEKNSECKLLFLNRCGICFYLGWILSLGLLSCKHDKEEDPIPYLVILLTQKEREALYDCPGSWRFTRMLESGVGTVCTQCHNEELRVNQFVVTDYNMVRERVVPRRPEESLVYQKVTEGTMRFYANDEIRRGIYCWIRQGAKN